MSLLKIPLWHTMPNGASVSDWLGTSAGSAQVAVAYIEQVRQESNNDPIGSLDKAEKYLVQALSELRAVRKECGRPGWMYPA